MDVQEVVSFPTKRMKDGVANKNERSVAQNDGRN